MDRRRFLIVASGVAAGAALTPWLLARSAPGALAAGRGDAPDLDALHGGWREFVPEGAELPAPGDPLDVTEAQWRERLSPEAFAVLFEDATERAGSSPLDREKREGVFVCAACSLPLFTSAMKFDSGTGWPSFFTAIPDHLATSKDFKLILPRTEYHCVRCGGHQGHVFEDGPAPTGQRWCNNGVALRFLPTEG